MMKPLTLGAALLVLLGCTTGGDTDPDTPVGDGGQHAADATGGPVCTPAATRCDGWAYNVCNGDGTAWDEVELCDADEMCTLSGCRPTSADSVLSCADAARTRSTIGCEYWPTPLPTSVAEDFTFALVVANGQPATAHITVDRLGEEVATLDLASGAIKVIELPWIEGFSRLALTESGDGEVYVPSFRASGAYHLRSDVPIVVAQFSPLEYSIPRDCAFEEHLPEIFQGELQRWGDDWCGAFSNDASLLLPTEAWGSNYILTGRTGAADGFATYAALVGTGDAPVEVEIRARSPIAEARDGSHGAIDAGETRTITLRPGEVHVLTAMPNEDGVAQLRFSCSGGGHDHEEPGAGATEECARQMAECEMSGRDCSVMASGDLTGTTLRADGPFGVYVGHVCANVPTEYGTCDHLEEQLVPSDTLGERVFVTAPQSLRGEPTLVRVLSASNGNRIEVTPSVVEPRTLELGEWFEFTITDEDVRIDGSGPILVTQFFVGQEFPPSVSDEEDANILGDPAMGMVTPQEQYRANQVFLTPASYSESWVSVLAPSETEVSIDGVAVTEWRETPSIGLRTARVSMAPGVHQLEATQPVGIVLYGFGDATSYLLMGGGNLSRISEAPF